MKLHTLFLSLVSLYLLFSCSSNNNCLDINSTDIQNFEAFGASSNDKCVLRTSNTNLNQIYVINDQSSFEQFVDCSGETVTIDFDVNTLLIGARQFSSETTWTGSSFTTNCQDNEITYTVLWETILSLPNAGTRTFHAIIPKVDESEYSFSLNHSITPQ
ncbi:MAG: hypothetical protein MK212_19565 [Saprospiraceae bacterium]|nr:hypothetical protein [Saprospiraceae bacterium]